MYICTPHALRRQKVVLASLELELQTVEGSHVGTEKHTQPALKHLVGMCVYVHVPV